MPKIRRIVINNFRGIHHLDYSFGDQNFWCFVGRGDSGKSTILEAISLALSPYKNLTICDTDFFDQNINEDIVIKAYLYELPKDLLKIGKFGEYLICLDNENEPFDQDDTLENACLCLELRVTSDLSFEWNVICPLHEEDSQKKSFSFLDRSTLGVFQINDFSKNHFSWGRYSPLRRVLENITPEGEFTKAERQLRESFTIPEIFNSVSDKLIPEINDLGLEINNISAGLDMDKISFNEGDISLHNGNIPLRLLGKGSRRIASIGIQKLAQKSKAGILLIDEIEQGLEPDRVKHVVRALLCENASQTFLTTHSPCVLEEIPAEYILITQRNNNGDVTLQPCTDAQQGILRSCPEAFYADKIIVCEGATEVGICRAIEKNYKLNFASKGIVYIDGKGDNFVDRALQLLRKNKDVILFYDADKIRNDKEKGPQIDKKIEDLSKEFQNVKHLTPENKNSIEEAVFKNIPINDFSKFLSDFSSHFVGVRDSFKSSTGLSEFNMITEENRLKVIGWVKKDTFKRMDKGEFLGDMICCAPYLPEDCMVKKNIKTLLQWIENKDHDGNK